MPLPAKYHIPQNFLFTEIINNSTKNTLIELANNNLNRQLIPNFKGTAKKYGLVESTLRRRFKNQTVLFTAVRAATY